MTAYLEIKAIWKVEGDDNEYETEQQAQIAEALRKSDKFYSSYDLRSIAKTIDESFHISGRIIKQPEDPSFLILEGEKKIAPFAGEQK